MSLKQRRRATRRPYRRSVTRLQMECHLGSWFDGLINAELFQLTSLSSIASYGFRSVTRPDCTSTKYSRSESLTLYCRSRFLLILTSYLAQAVAHDDCCQYFPLLAFSSVQLPRYCSSPTGSSYLSRLSTESSYFTWPSITILTLGLAPTSQHHYNFS